VFYNHVQSGLTRARELKHGETLRSSPATVRILLAVFLIAGFSSCLFGQTASTGALAGRILDPSGALVRGAEVELTNPASGESRPEISDASGNFHFLLLPPGLYELQAIKTGFAPVRLVGLNVLITETLEIQVQLRLASVKGSVLVYSEAPMVQTGTIALGRVVNQTAVTAMLSPSFIQILRMSLASARIGRN